LVPGIGVHHGLQMWQRFSSFQMRASRMHGDVYATRALFDGGEVTTSHPDHVKSLFTAKVEHVPSLVAESPLAPVVGPSSVLTAQGARHLRQRRLLLPPFHGEAIERYREMIHAAIDDELDGWSSGQEVHLADRMSAVTLDVIMSGVFGVDGVAKRLTPARWLRSEVSRATKVSTWPVFKLVELYNRGNGDPSVPLKLMMLPLDGAVKAVIAQRRRDPRLDERTDILSLLMRATTEEGETLSDQELRDELMSLLLAGHETTANTLAWTWERLVRHPDAYAQLRDAVQAGGESADAMVDAVIYESMRVRPVIPGVGRRVTVPWRLGEFVIPADTPVFMSIMVLHHREDLYPEPKRFLPERWLGHTPGTYEWIPFGGGTRRCLGAALAMAELRVVLRRMVERVDVVAVTPRPERLRHRNVTLIPSDGGRVRVTATRR
jgi:cytochrome P450